VTGDGGLPALGDLVERLLPRDAREPTSALGTDATLRVKQPVGGTHVVEVTVDLGAQRAPRVRMLAITA
jgi:hypothetical protein